MMIMYIEILGHNMEDTRAYLVYTGKNSVKNEIDIYNVAFKI